MRRFFARPSGLLLSETGFAHDPDSDLAHFNIAEIQRQRGNDAAAIEHYREALRIKPGLKEAQTGLAACLRHLTMPKNPGRSGTPPGERR